MMMMMMALCYTILSVVDQAQLAPPFLNIIPAGHKSTTPAWLVCAKLLHDWVPFAVDTLRFNPELIVVSVRVVAFI